MVTLLTYWRIVLPISLLVLGMSALHFYVASEKRHAVESVTREINRATAEQVVIDEKAVYEAYRESGVINDYVERVFDLPSEPEEPADRSRGLLSTEADPSAINRHEKSPHGIPPAVLSDQEVDEAVRKYADLLQ